MAEPPSWVARRALLAKRRRSAAAAVRAWAAALRVAERPLGECPRAPALPGTLQPVRAPTVAVRPDRVAHRADSGRAISMRQATRPALRRIARCGRCLARTPATCIKCAEPRTR